MLESSTIRKMESGIFFLEALIVFGVMCIEFTPGREMKFWIKLFPYVLLLTLSLFPYYLFNEISKKIYKTQSNYVRGSFIITLVGLPILVFLYLNAYQVVNQSSSSTASLIYVVLPVYILIVGGLLYGAVYLASKNA